jgi:hypothetical protein
MARTKRGAVGQPLRGDIKRRGAGNLAARQAEADRIYFQEMEESAFKHLLSQFGEPILGTPLQTVAPSAAAAMESDSESDEESIATTEDGGYSLCSGTCGRQMHHEDTNDQGQCGRCEAGFYLADVTDAEADAYFAADWVKRPSPIFYVDLTADSEDESGFQSPAPLRCPVCSKLYCRMRGQHHVAVIDLTV